MTWISKEKDELLRNQARWWQCFGKNENLQDIIIYGSQAVFWLEWPKLCRDPGSNRGPLDLQSNALPTELSRLSHVKSDMQLSTGMTWNELPIWKKGIPKVIDKVDANVIIQFFAKNGQ